jgi:hypothetical protein
LGEHAGGAAGEVVSNSEGFAVRQNLTGVFPKTGGEGSKLTSFHNLCPLGNIENIRYFCVSNCIAMGQITLEIDDRKMKFFKNLVSHFSFVKIKEEVDDDQEDTDEQVRENIKAAIKELREIEAGKKKARLASDFLKEL